MRRRSPLPLAPLALFVFSALLLSCNGGDDQSPRVPALVATTLTATPSSSFLHPNESQQLTIAIKDQLGEPMSDSSLTFTSTAPTVFSVTSKGLITSLGPPGSGTVEIKVGTVTEIVGVFVGDGPVGRVVATTPVAGSPYPAAVSGDGNMYVGVFGSDRVLRGRVGTYDFPVSLKVGYEPFGLGLSPSGNILYAALVDQPKKQAVSEFSIARNRLLPSFKIWSDVFSVVTSIDGRKVFASTTGWVYVFDAESQARIDSFPAAVAMHMVASRTQPVIFSSNLYGGSVTEYNYVTKTVTAIPVGGVPEAVGLSPSGNELYVVDQTGFLQEWSLSAKRMVRLVPLAGQAFGLAVSNDRVLVTLPDEGKVQLFDRVSLVLLNTFDTGGSPRGLAYDAYGTVAIVANQSGWVDFIQ